MLLWYQGEERIILIARGKYKEKVYLVLERERVRVKKRGHGWVREGVCVQV